MIWPQTLSAAARSKPATCLKPKIYGRHGSWQSGSVYSPGGCLQFAQVSTLGQSRISIEMSRHVRFRPSSAYTELLSAIFGKPARPEGDIGDAISRRQQ